MAKYYKYYSCYDVIGYNELSYECMCFHSEDEVQFRGICKNCEIIPVEKWNEVPDNNHNLKKIHTYSDEFKQIMKEICDRKESFTFVREGDYMRE